MDNICFVSDKWKDYELIDAGDGMRLERWGKVILMRPDPQALWPKSHNRLWSEPDAVYHRSHSGGGKWEFIKKLPEEWILKYGELVFKVRPTNFKHTGLFPEQAYNWDKIMSNTIKGDKILNLFGYTGAASVAAAKAGGQVVHVDASKGVLTWCKDNARLSGLNEQSIRLILDDCTKFVERESRRENYYDAIIMDPPSFGRGAKGEVWKLEDNLWKLLKVCEKILSPDSRYFLLNSYTAGISPIVAANMISSMSINLKKITYGELTLPFRKGEMLLPCGITVWAE